MSVRHRFVRRSSLTRSCACSPGSAKHVTVNVEFKFEFPLSSRAHIKLLQAASVEQVDSDACESPKALLCACAAARVEVGSVRAAGRHGLTG